MNWSLLGNYCSMGAEINDGKDEVEEALDPTVSLLSAIDLLGKDDLLRLPPSTDDAEDIIDSLILRDGPHEESSTV